MILVWLLADVIPAPNLAGMQGSNPGINAISPRLTGTIGSQTDLPSTVERHDHHYRGCLGRADTWLRETFPSNWYNWNRNKRSYRRSECIGNFESVER